MTPIVTAARPMPLTLRVFGTRARALAGRARHTFGSEGGRIGRALDNDWVLPDPERYVSSHHARIVFSDGRYNLLDISSNGTFVNGAKVAIGRQGSHTLESGDQIAIGGYELLVEIGAPSDEDINAALATEPLVPISTTPTPDLGEALEMSGSMRRSPDGEHLGHGDHATASSQALQTFQRGIGLDIDAAGATEHPHLLGIAGLLLREMTTGLVALAHERRSRRDDLSDSKTGRFDLRRDPIAHAGSVDEALSLLLTAEQRRLIPPVEAVRGAFSALETERRTSVDAARQAVADALARMDPETLEQRFGAATDDAQAAHCWRQYRALHAKLVGGDGLPTTWNNDYEAALRRLTNASG